MLIVDISVVASNLWLKTNIADSLVSLTVPFSKLLYNRKVQSNLLSTSSFFLQNWCFFSLQGGAKGPGIFFIIPCTDSYQKVDLRTVSFDVPPQEVKHQLGVSPIRDSTWAIWSLTSFKPQQQISTCRTRLTLFSNERNRELGIQKSYLKSHAP